MTSAELARVPFSVPWRATLCDDRRCARGGGLAGRRRGALRRADDASRSHRRRRSRHFPPAAICAAAESRRLQQAAEHHGVAHRAGDGDRRWRQRHGPSGDVARRRRSDCHCPRDRRQLGRRAAFQSRRAGRALRGNAGSAGHDRAAMPRSPMPTTWRRGAAPILLLGTNPLAIGVPTGDKPLVFDMATSIVAYGTVKKYALRGLHHAGGLVRRCRERRADHRSGQIGRRACCCRWANTKAVDWR